MINVLKLCSFELVDDVHPTITVTSFTYLLRGFTSQMPSIRIVDCFMNLQWLDGPHWGVS